MDPSLRHSPPRRPRLNRCLFFGMMAKTFRNVGCSLTVWATKHPPSALTYAFEIALRTRTFVEHTYTIASRKSPEQVLVHCVGWDNSLIPSPHPFSLSYQCFKISRIREQSLNVRLIPLYRFIQLFLRTQRLVSLGGNTDCRFRYIPKFWTSFLSSKALWAELEVVHPVPALGSRCHSSSQVKSGK